VAYRRLEAGDQFWRPSNVMGVLNTDLAKQLEATKLTARLWRLEPGQASTWHRHHDEEELYVVLEGEGRMRVDDDTLSLGIGDTVLVDPGSMRQVFNDGEAEALWLIVGTPPGPASTLEMDEETLAFMYPEGPKALPPELGG
jgi:mannose-6-phosphate isomerase-like protein (cupin superfamily)